MDPNRSWTLWMLTGAIALQLGCADGEEGSRARPASSIPESVVAPAAAVEVGTASGTLRRHVTVPGFSVTRFPVTVAQYRECVSARACGIPRKTGRHCGGTVDEGGLYTYDEVAGGSDTLAVTCASPKQASAFCRWVGGRLPKLEEWLYSARGPTVRKYSWSGSALSCDLHPAVAALPGSECCPNGCSKSELLGIGHHPKGTSPLGVEDILLTRAELMIASDDAGLPACKGTGACVAVTNASGSIDAVMPVAGEGSVNNPAWSFRCVWEG